MFIQFVIWLCVASCFAVSFMTPLIPRVYVVLKLKVFSYTEYFEMNFIHQDKKVKLSRNRPGQALGVPGG